MKLADWLKVKDLSPEEFGKLLRENDVSTAMAAKRIRRYCLPRNHGENRIPRPETMDRIVALTNGAVTANDFYDIDIAAQDAA